ncbi:hypothetical protein XSR1_140062 [Xenorhabdus szentirmaii DSM 16338]|uniref:Uncharacterized protein n=1 Tax=Xenorhabdus szentirmaii DSM 16338 TaxID=1427518 RepID=W1IWK1_9GAMM|nr:hypothetical protein XSR1_140062 [Xenorhabdus szentirmaii DSM 16338]
MLACILTEPKTIQQCNMSGHFKKYLFLRPEADIFTLILVIKV